MRSLGNGAPALSFERRMIRISMSCFVDEEQGVGGKFNSTVILLYFLLFEVL